ncbi:MAG TPA: sulfite oxidase [Gammaproteobacteria bacterium]|nr:MAG: sulfite oxidase [Gammaproteobacteria bacterium TMED163]HBQ01758.1 sulfite oxidase [Gammaproteobacteria bacterium]|tara:strand:+ start:2092 stop:3243 length:1152 start_codon:yes stop_codon:yes gene_type:complete
MNPEDTSRRKVLKGGMMAAGAAAAPSFILPALAQGERLVPFTDVPESFQIPPQQPNSTYWQDTREISEFVTDNEDFYLVQHYGQPEVDNDAWRLRVTGMVDNELEFSLSDLMNGNTVEQQVGFECGGNSQRLFHGLIGNANWRGVSLRDILQRAGIQDGAKEVVFFGADVATEEIRGREVDKAFARGLSIPDAMREENMLAFEMNGEPLPHYHGKPLRLIVPGWYGVANVKWLTQIHVQNTRYMGRFMGRDYVTLKKENVGGVERWVENSVTTMNLKSSIVRVTEMGGRYSIQGFVLNDGTPLRSVEIKIDDGPWQSAEMNPNNTQYSWKLFSLDWTNPTPGDHTLVSRVTDINGNVQATPAELPEKVSYWEDFGQFTRTITI